MKNIKEIEEKVKEPKGAYLEGVILPNGEFICNGRSILIRPEDKVFEDTPNKTTK